MYKKSEQQHKYGSVDALASPPTHGHIRGNNASSLYNCLLPCFNDKSHIKNKTDINICFCIDGNYVAHTIAAITSLLINSNPGDKINIYVLSINLDNRSVNAIKFLENIYEFNLHIKHLSLKKIQSVIKDNAISVHACVKLLLPYIIPTEIEKIIYLDGDVIIERSLNDLYNKDISKYYLAAVEDNVNVEKRWRLEYPYKVYRNHYINAGVLLLNLKKLRDYNLIDKAVNYFPHIIDPSHGDEEIINVLFGDNGIMLLPMKYNMQYWKNIHNGGLDGSLVASELGKSNEHVIIHFTGSYKPWDNKSLLQVGNKWGDKYYSYRRKSGILACLQQYSLNINDNSTVLIVFSSKSRRYADYCVGLIKQFYENNTVELHEIPSLLDISNDEDMYSKYDAAFFIWDDALSHAKESTLKQSLGCPVYILSQDISDINVVVSYQDVKIEFILSCFKQYADVLESDSYELVCNRIELNKEYSNNNSLNYVNISRNLCKDSLIEYLLDGYKYQFVGENFMYIPCSNKWNYIGISNLSPHQLYSLSKDGYKPSVIIEYSKNVYQCILMFPNLYGDYNDEIIRCLAQQLNSQYKTLQVSVNKVISFAPGLNSYYLDDNNSYVEYSVKLKYAEKNICYKLLHTAEAIYKLLTTKGL